MGLKKRAAQVGKMFVEEEDCFMMVSEPAFRVKMGTLGASVRAETQVVLSWTTDTFQ